MTRFRDKENRLHLTVQPVLYRLLLSVFIIEIDELEKVFIACLCLFFVSLEEYVSACRELTCKS